MNNEIDEEWLDLSRIRNRNDDIVAISNTGKYRRHDGSDGILSIRRYATYDGRKVSASRIIAEHFLITVKRPDQNCIDHITHWPTEYNVNNVLNLRWCTKAENSRFEEARENRSRDKAPRWKGDDVGPGGSYQRAKKLYKAGKITEEEFQPYRDEWIKYKSARKKQTGAQHVRSLTEKE